MTNSPHQRQRRAEATRILTALEAWSRTHLSDAQRRGDRPAIAHWTRESNMYTHALRSLPASDAERLEELITTHGPLAQEITRP
ncbi:hypothetical protein ACFRCG_12685 [Embleya sp. NPDC056575]|uniref:hypothetical protein n=1 Tax=unclassified Embleya TaxID=2699296 RepID=UPI0036B57C29